mmetsp:Transcript_75997/g.198206  ORF Transcript_75997/g.198206 Transcript_75997/m.198206 type:complete len:222 (+) Transcript_75997:288-953(+)
MEHSFWYFSSRAIPCPMPLSRSWITSACLLSAFTFSTNWVAFWHCFWAKHISWTRSWPFATPFSFWRPVTNSSGETLPFRSASMISKRASASSDMIPSSRSFSVIEGVFNISENSWMPSSPSSLSSASVKSEAIDMNRSCSVCSKTLLAKSLFSCAMVRMRSTITAMTIFSTPKVPMTTVRKTIMAAGADTSITGRRMSLHQLSSVIICMTLHTAFHTLPK